MGQVGMENPHFRGGFYLLKQVIILGTLRTYFAVYQRFRPV